MTRTRKRKRSLNTTTTSIESSFTPLSDPNAGCGSSTSNSKPRATSSQRWHLEQPSTPSKEIELSVRGRKAQYKVGVKSAASQMTALSYTLPPEIWSLVGEKMFHPPTLRSLVRVSRAFHDIFTPILYRCRIINLEYFAKPPEQTSLPPYLEYVQDFRINIYEFARGSPPYDTRKRDKYALWLLRALKSIKDLRRFSWRNESFEESSEIDLILSTYKLSQALRNNETLRSICIQFGAQFVHDYNSLDDCYVTLQGFRNLTSLELYDFYSNHEYMVEDLAYVLCHSPLLKKLGLALASLITRDDYPSVLFGGQSNPMDFFERVCEKYGSICKRGPLAIETLRLGHGICLGKPSIPKNNHYFTKLIALERLQVLHIFNGLVFSEDEVGDSFYMPVDWSPFISDKCTSLRQLSVDRLEKDVMLWLKQHGTYVRELIVTDHYSFDDPGLNQFNELPISRLTMLWMREKHPSHSSSVNAGFWIESNPATSGAQSAAPKSDKRIMTVLDRLPDGGCHLVSLCIALDFETQWLQFSSHLERLPCLTHLRLNAKSHRGGGYPTLASSIWPDTNEDTENIGIARRFAQLISKMCPSLRYIMIGPDLTCEVIRPKADKIGDRTRSRSGITLRSLDRTEIEEIEVFNLSDFTDQGGLLGPERDRPEKPTGPELSLRQINALLSEQGLSPLPV